MDLIHVDDVCNAILKSCKSKKTGTYNLSSGVGVTPLELAKTISALTRNCVISIKNKKSETNHFLYDVSKIQQEFGFKSKIKPNSKILKPWLQEIIRSKKNISRNLNNKREC
jgi:nucleoside-diphosphate-sugar epimerase